MPQRDNEGGEHSGVMVVMVVTVAERRQSLERPHLQCDAP